MIAHYITNTPVASFIFALTIGFSIYSFSNPELLRKWMLHPYSIYRDKSKWYQIFTSGLIHKDWMHLLFNMITFYYFGFALEGVFVTANGAMGHFYFAGLYLVSLVLSDLPTIAKYKEHYGYFSLGASGAISAVLFSFILFYPTSKLYLFMAIPMPAFLFGFVYLGYCVWASKNADNGINHDAHLFGALAGLVITILLFPNILSHFIGQF